MADRTNSNCSAIHSLLHRSLAGKALVKALSSSAVTALTLKFAPTRVADSIQLLTLSEWHAATFKPAVHSMRVHSNVCCNAADQKAWSVANPAQSIHHRVAGRDGPSTTATGSASGRTCSAPPAEQVLMSCDRLLRSHIDAAQHVEPDMQQEH